MTNLSCNAMTCINNRDNCCCLSGIDVQGDKACKCDDTCCGSYCYETDTSARNSANSPKLSLNINCKAHNCMYNMNEQCTADHVDISGIHAANSEDTVCTTFISK